MNWTAIRLTLELAVLTAVILLVVGLPIAYWITYSRRRWKFLVESVVALPLVLPPTVLGFYILVAIGPHSPLGRWYAELVGHPLPFTFEGLLFASVLYSLPFAVQPFSSGFEQVDRRLIEMSWTLGVSKLSTFIKLIIPLSTAGIVTGFVLSFAHTLGEFGVGRYEPVGDGQVVFVGVLLLDRAANLDGRGAAVERNLTNLRIVRGHQRDDYTQRDQPVASAQEIEIRIWV